MPLVFSKYATTFVRLMVLLVRNSKATPATSSTTRAAATQPLRMRLIVRPPLARAAAAPHPAPASRQGSAWEWAWSPDPAAARQGAPAADHPAVARATARDTGSSRWGRAAASRADHSPDRRDCR